MAKTPCRLARCPRLTSQFAGNGDSGHSAGGRSLLFSWYYHPFFAEGTDGVLAPQLFDLRGVVFAGWTLAAFAIGVFAGVVIRRTVPAMAVALAAWTGLDLATVLFLRKHYAPLVTGKVQAGAGNSHSIPWVVAQWWQGPNGALIGPETIRSISLHAPVRIQAQIQAKGDDPLVSWLGQHGYTQWMSYQPASRFWYFQLAEGGWLLALALILDAATIWLVRRRAA